MVQSPSNSSSKTEGTTPPTIEIPRRSLSTEFYVGIFAIITLAAMAWLAVGLGELKIFGSNRYVVYAEFDNISGVKVGASVEVAGVPVGEVTSVELKDPSARIALSIDPSLRLVEDDIASIRTKGIIGDRYVRISRGASEKLLKDGETLFQTESVVDIEDIIGKLVHSLSSGKDGE